MLLRPPFRFSKIIFGAVLLWSATASAQQAWTTRQVSVRAGPDLTYPAVATVGAGYPVDVAGCLSDYSWCDVEFNNGYDRGWVPARRLQYNYGGRRVPLYSYSSSIGLPTVTFSLLGYWDNYYQNRSWYRDRPRWYSAPRSNWSHDRRNFVDDRRDFRNDRRDERIDRRDDRRDGRNDRRDGQWREQPRFERPRGEQFQAGQLRQDNPRENRGAAVGGADGRRAAPQAQAQAQAPQGQPAARVQPPQSVPAQPVPVAPPPRFERNDQPRNQGRPDGQIDRPRQREVGQN